MYESKSRELLTWRVRRHSPSIKSGNSDAKKKLKRSERRKEGNPSRKSKGKGSKVVQWKLYP